MKNVILLAGLVFFFVACTGNKAGQETNGETTAQEQVDNHKSVVPTSVLSAEIAGMSCVKGCGSSIRKELYGNGGISKVEYDFEENREFNGIKVYYDENQISEDEIILALTTMEEHKYTIEEPHSEKIEK